MIEFKIIATPDKSQIGNYQHPANEMIFGSAEGDMIIDDVEISERQARIYLAGAEFLLENLDPSVPIKLNGRPVTGATPIKTRDSLNVGHTTIQMSLLDGKPAAPPEPFTHTQAEQRFAPGAKEEAMLKVLEHLAGTPAQSAPPAMPQGMPKPPPLPK